MIKSAESTTTLENVIFESNIAFANTGNIYSLSNSAIINMINMPTPTDFVIAAVTSCTAGEFQTYLQTSGNLSNRFSCKTCPAGYYQVTTAQSGCTACQIGKYLVANTNAGASTPALRAVEAAKHNSEALCLKCLVGFEFTSITTPCQVCAGGKFQDTETTNGKPCASCPPNKFIADHRNDDSYHDDSADCLSCSLGTFSPAGALFCDRCFAGTREFKNKTSNETKCISCKSGRYQDLSGNDTCVDCPIGWFQALQGKEFCLPCVPGEKGTPSRVRCDKCPEGYYSDQQKQSECTKASDGAIVMGGGATSVEVPLGSFKQQCNDKGLACLDFTQCPQGWHGLNPAATFCKECPTGYSSIKGQDFCPTCTKGQFGFTDVVTGGGECKNCPIGYFQSEDKAVTACSVCPEGFTQDLEGESSCLDSGGIKAGDCGDNEYWAPDKFPDRDLKSQAGCVSCPNGGSCIGAIGKEDIRALFGWSKCPNLNLTYSPCKFGAACNGAKNKVLEGKFIDEERNNFDPAMNDQNESCSVAYKNNSFLCSACAENFSHSGLGDKCDVCPTPADNTAIAVAGGVAGIAGLFVYVYITLSDEGKIDPVDGAKSIALSYIQIISLLKTFPIAWPDIFVSIFRIGGAVGKYLQVCLLFSVLHL